MDDMGGSYPADLQRSRQQQLDYESHAREERSRREDRDREYNASGQSGGVGFFALLDYLLWGSSSNKK